MNLHRARTPASIAHVAARSYASKPSGPRRHPTCSNSRFAEGERDSLGFVGDPSSYFLSNVGCGDWAGDARVAKRIGDETCARACTPSGPTPSRPSLYRSYLLSVGFSSPLGGSGPLLTQCTDGTTRCEPFGVQIGTGLGEFAVSPDGSAIEDSWTSPDGSTTFDLQLEGVRR